jgi:hypothetical protein
VLHWLHLVSARAEDTPLVVDNHADDRAWLIFVEFQWELRKGRSQAVNYLSSVCHQLGYIPPEVYVVIEISPNEQSVGPMIIDPYSWPLYWEKLNAFVDGIDPIRQVDVTAFHQLVNVPTGVSNTSLLNSSTIDSCRMVLDVHTTSDGASTCNIEPYTYMAAYSDSSIVKIESEHSRGPPEQLNTSLAYWDQQSLLLVSQSGQYPAIKMEDVKLDNWLCVYGDLPSDAIEEEEAEFNPPAGFDEAQQTFLIDRPKVPLPYFPPIWAQVGSSLFWRFTNPEIWRHQSRQEICESFGWFRSYQGGVYHTREIVKGYLLGGFSARSYIIFYRYSN